MRIKISKDVFTIAHSKNTTRVIKLDTTLILINHVDLELLNEESISIKFWNNRDPFFNGVSIHSSGRTYLEKKSSSGLLNNSIIEIK
jgi:hypothetical protein